MKLRIMVVDDEMIIRESFFHWFEKSGHIVETAATGFEALEKCKQAFFDVLFVDIKMPKMSGVQVLETVKKEYPDTIVVIITAFGTIETAVEAMKKGAADYLLKPFKPEQLDLVLEKIVRQKKLALEHEYLKRRLDAVTRFENIIGQSSEMVRIFELISEVAKSDAAVLILGETGTGKELIAKAIHSRSRRKDSPFIAINCGAIPDSLLESELFGHQKGAFTGASNTRKGFLEVVSGGTLFLDEIGEISSKMQVDLLRVLEEKKITRVGDSYPLVVDFRLISASRQDIEKKMADHTFRRDFYYRINVIAIDVPPLRKRKEDIHLLAPHFLKKYSQATNKRIDGIGGDAMDVLVQYDWPGNIRELANAVERAVVLSGGGMLGLKDFAFIKTADIRQSPARSLEENEKTHIHKILKQTNWNITSAAEVLGIHRATLHKKIKRYRLARRPNLP